MAIKTDAIDEREFIEEMSALLSNMLKEGAFMDAPSSDSDPAAVAQEAAEDFLSFFSNDWEFQFRYWLPQIVDICCKYRGYKSGVYVKRVIIAGRPSLNGMTMIAKSQDKDSLSHDSGREPEKYNP